MIFTTSELFGWSCLYLALQYSDHVREVEQRVAAMRQEAMAAQMRALQYQVSPHFLFNTLNSVAGLIEENASAQAHEMILGLASFLRQTVTLNPEHDIRLADELAIQMNYLGIEKVRFSDRMQVRTEVAAGLDLLLVPPLILQPLVENAVKYGISQMQGPAELVIGVADEPKGTLRLWVENTVPANVGGMENVAHRLQARWPGQCACEATLSALNRFKVQITLPMSWGGAVTVTTVLVVDDEPIARRRLIRMLRRLEMVAVVGEAANVDQAVAEVERLNPDLLLDIQMPGGDGFGVLKRLQASAPAVWTAD